MIATSQVVVFSKLTHRSFLGEVANIMRLLVPGCDSTGGKDVSLSTSTNVQTRILNNAVDMFVGDP